MKKVLLYILVFLIILISDDTYLFSSAGIDSLVMVKYVFLACLPFFLNSQNRKQTNNIIYIFIIILVLSSLANISYFGLGVVLLLIVIVAAYMFSKKYALGTFAGVFADLVVIICIYSLLIYLMTTIIAVIKTSSVINTGGQLIRYAGGCLIFDHYGLLARLSSIFREPGVFTVYINLALFFDLFVNNKPNKVIRIAIYVLSLLASFSTGGLATFATIIILFGLKSKKKTYSIIAGLFLLIISAFIMGNEDVYAMFFNKIEGGMDTSSSLGRVSSIFIPFTIWTQDVGNFVFGCGVKNFHDAYILVGRELYHVLIDPQGLSTNTIMNSFALFGIGFGTLLLVGLVKFVNLIGENKIEKFIALLAFLFIFSNENMLYSLPIYILVMYGYLGDKKMKYTRQCEK